MLNPRARTLIAVLMSAIAAFSVAQTSGIVPGIVAADSTLSLQFSRASTSTEQSSATGTVEVNTQTGHVSVELHQATPNSAYMILFATGSTNVQLGTITTSGSGDGSFETNLGAGTYAGIFQVLKVGILQFVTASTSFTITASASASITGSASTNVTSTETSETSSQTSTSVTSSGETAASIQVEPSIRTITAGAFAKFNINIRANGSANVLLAAKSIPPHSVAIFTQNLGVANPEFHSTLTILTASDTPSGTYGITLITLINGQEFDSQIGLEVTASSSVSASATVSGGVSLDIALATDQHHYQVNGTVNLEGHVTDNSGSAAADANVAVQVDGPTGVEIVSLNNLKTDSAGVFHVTFSIPPGAAAGTYTVFATASKSGFAGATTHTTFVVGISSTPSVVIKDVFVTDMSGTPTATFSVGQTVLIWVIVENSGANFEGVIWIQVRDPNGTPIWIQFQITQLGTGQTVKVAFGFTIPANMTAGLYTANALVSDKLISQGGTFLASANTQFALTSAT